MAANPSNVMPASRIELLTPCFCAGVDPKAPELRAASVRGQLRFWTRVLNGAGKPEYSLFGGIKGKAHGYPDEAVASAIILRVKTLGKSKPAEQPLCPHDPQKGRRAALPAGTLFELRWFERFTSFADRVKRFEEVLLTWQLLGGLGARVTRAAGSVWPAEYAPTLAEFSTRLGGLSIPSTVRVGVLAKVASKPEVLREIATNTVKGAGRNTGAIKGLLPGDPLGFASGQERKVSPLKLKVGRFADGFRLIAVADNRHQRGGDLPAAIRAMKQRNKPLADLLMQAGFDKA
ncbi:MAG: hypothetical protein FJY37_18715 [Betaproteobacteria bacterium]|nr:hypothetical protein [Betaproteobacteria bacterium]